MLGNPAGALCLGRPTPARGARTHPRLREIE